MNFGRVADGDFWEWDEAYAQNLISVALSEAGREYVAYLGEGNALVPRALAMFGECEVNATTVVQRCVK